MSKNLIMVDYAAQDPRSVSAMLRGKGDGRQKAWLNFEKNHPEITDMEELSRAYSRAAREDSIRLNAKSKLSRLTKVLIVLGVFIIVC